jgi:hypothetical protein
MNAMAKAVVAPKVAASKPRASAFMGRPAALKARVAGTSHRPLNACQKTMKQKRILFPFFAISSSCANLYRPSLPWS